MDHCRKGDIVKWILLLYDVFTSSKQLDSSHFGAFSLIEFYIFPLSFDFYDLAFISFGPSPNNFTTFFFELSLSSLSPHLFLSSFLLGFFPSMFQYSDSGVEG